jgi:hypothetical protein
MLDSWLRILTQTVIFLSRFSFLFGVGTRRKYGKYLITELYSDKPLHSRCVWPGLVCLGTRVRKRGRFKERRCVCVCVHLGVK